MLSPQWQALLFGVGVIAVLGITYAVGPRIARLLPARELEKESDKDLILVAAGNPQTAKSLVHLASVLAQASEDSYICVLAVESTALRANTRRARRLARRRSGMQERMLLDQVADEARSRNVALYAKSRVASSVAEGSWTRSKSATTSSWCWWVGQARSNGKALAQNPVKLVLQRAHTNVVALLDRGLSGIQRILVPVGGGPHSRLALRLAYEIALAEDAQVTALRVVPQVAESEELEDQTLLLEELVVDVLCDVPKSFTLRATQAASVPDGILAESVRQSYDLIVIGASEEWAWHSRLFGSVDDWLAQVAPCSVLFCRRHEPVAISWLRRGIKVAEGGYRMSTMEQRLQEGSASCALEQR